MENQEIIWKDVEGYEKSYMVSNTGLIKSKSRCIVKKCGRTSNIKGRILKQKNHRAGYKVIETSYNGIHKTLYTHRLVATAFLPIDPKRNVVDHINGIRIDNRVENLRWCNHRENITFENVNRVKNKGNKYVGVAKTKSNKYRATICEKGIFYVLGIFENEEKASDAYKFALNQIEKGEKITYKIKKENTSKYLGVYRSPAKRKETYIAQSTINGIRVHLGSFESEFLAHQAYIKHKKEHGK